MIRLIIQHHPWLARPVVQAVVSLVWTNRLPLVMIISDAEVGLISSIVF